MAYLDNSGLYIKIGAETTTPKVAGEPKTFGELREIDCVINLAALTTTLSIIDDTNPMPTGMRIQEVEVMVDTAATSGGAATLDIGLIRTDRTTVTDATAFVAAMPLATITPAGKKIVLNVGSTNVGTSVGTTTSTVNHIAARANTAVFTAGVVRVRIRYYRP